jgi:outer membrane receptor for ferrienterochelin and colicin
MVIAQNRDPSMVSQHGASRNQALSRICAVALCLGTLSPAVREARAQDETLLFQDVTRVSGASRYEQDTREAPASITIVTAEDIRRYGYRTLAEVLANVRGFAINNDRNYSYVGVRGFAVPGDFNSRVLFLVDGHPINDGVFQSALIDNGALTDLRTVDRIEIIRGPSSSVYGTSALFGVVNIITLRGRALNGVEVGSSFGTWDTYRASLVAGRRIAGGVEFLASANLFRSAGEALYFPGIPTNGGHAIGVDGDRYDRQFAKIGVGDWTVEVGRSWRQKHIPTGSYGTIFDDPRAATVDAHSFAFVRNAHGFADASRIEATFGYDAYSYQGHYPYSDGLLVDYARARWWSFDGQYVRLVGAAHRLVAGTELRWDTHQDQGAGNADSGTRIFDSRRAGAIWALFAQDEWHVTRRLSINAGVRHDHYDTFGGITNPRLSVVYQAGKLGTVKLLYGQAFRAPNAYELDYQDGGLTMKTPASLRPEQIKSYELAVEAAPTPGLHLSGSVYRLHLRDLVTQVIDPADSLLVYRNIGEIRSQGVELEADLRSAGGTGAELSYALQDVDDAVTGADLPSAPRHIGTVRLTIPVAGDRLRASVAARYIAAQWSPKGANVGASTIADLTLQSHLTGRVTLSANAYNLFDVSYAQPGGSEQVVSVIPQSRRTLRVGLQVRF